jgi:hypothetical protein
MPTLRTLWGEAFLDSPLSSLVVLGIVLNQTGETVAE